MVQAWHRRIGEMLLLRNRYHRCPFRWTEFQQHPELTTLPAPCEGTNQAGVAANACRMSCILQQNFCGSPTSQNAVWSRCFGSANATDPTALLHASKKKQHLGNLTTELNAPASREQTGELCGDLRRLPVAGGGVGIPRNCSCLARRRS